MSIEVVNWVLKHSEERLGRRLVLIALADCSHDDGTSAWPSVQTIAIKARLTSRQVQRCLRDLEGAGAIQKDGKSAAGTTVYTIVMDAGQNVTPDISDTNRYKMSPESSEASSSSSPPNPPMSPSPAEGLWAAYLAMRDSSPKKMRNRTLDVQTKRMIEKALTVGSAEEWSIAVRAILRSPHHVGKNDRRKTYLEPRHLFTACTHGTIRGHLDWLLDLAPQTAGGVVDTSGADVKMRQAMKFVLDAYDLAGSVEAQSNGDEAERFLVANGWTVVREPNFRPRFMRQ